MIDEEDVLDYLEHFGVRGMRWGVRRAQRYSPPKRFKDRSVQQRLGIGVVGLGTSFAVSKFLSKKTMNLPVSAIAGFASGIAAEHVAQRLLDKHGKKKVSTIRNKH